MQLTLDVFPVYEDTCACAECREICSLPTEDDLQAAATDLS